MKPKIAVKIEKSMTRAGIEGILDQLKPLKEEIDFILLEDGIKMEVIPQVSMLDYFAGQAMSGLIARNERCVPLSTLTSNAYNIADAMVEYSKKLEKENV